MISDDPLLPIYTLVILVLLYGVILFGRPIWRALPSDYRDYASF